MNSRKYRLFYVGIILGLSIMIISVENVIDRMYASKQNIYARFVQSVDADGGEGAGGTAEESGEVTEGEEGNDAAAAQVVAPAKADSLSDMIKTSQNIAVYKMFSKAQLSDYAYLSNFYTVTTLAGFDQSILKPEEFINKDLSVPMDKNNYQILIFHTHSQEGFTDTVDTDTSIVGVGEYLANVLREYGYMVYHDTSVYDYVDGVLDRSKAYDYAEAGVKKILEEYPTIEVVIDLHRDGVSESTRLITNQNGVEMAKVMLFNGVSNKSGSGDIGYLPNPNRDDNLATSLQLYLLGQQYYPGYFRKIYINAYRYCLHLRGRSLLVEAGAQTNTSEEVKAAMRPLADVLNRMLEGEKAY